MNDILTGRVISGEREVSRVTITERAGCAASGFAALGVGAGDAIAVILRNDFPFFEASYGAQRLGAYCVPVNWHGKTPELAYVLNDCGAKAVVAHSDFLPQVAPAVPEGVPLLVAPTPPEIAAAYGIPAEQCRVPTRVQLWDEWLAGFPRMPEGTPGDISNMILYLGDDREPKRRAAPHFGLGLCGDDRSDCARGLWLSARPTNQNCDYRPVIHSVPNAYALRAVREDALVVLQPRFDAGELLRLIEQYRITHLQMVPTMFARLLRLPAAVRRRTICRLSFG